MAKRKPVTIKRLTEAAEVISDLHNHYNEQTKHTKGSLLDMTDYELDCLRNVGLFQATRIQMLDILKMMYLSKRVMSTKARKR